MDSRPVKPTIYWVIGNETNAGKTTIASALIKVLNERGSKTIGFKPFAASRLQDVLDLMLEEYPTSPSKLFGGDAWKLTMASPWTGVDCLDLVVPVQALCYPNWESIIMVRTGSHRLENVAYYCTRRAAALKNRVDVQSFARISGLPLDNSTILKEDVGFQFAAGMAPEKQRHAFAALLDIGVDTVVCEGAGHWLPMWPGCPTPNHLILVGNGIVTLFPDIAISPAPAPNTPLQGIGVLSKIFKNPAVPRVSVPLFLAEEKRRGEMAQQICRELMSKAYPGS